MEVKLIIRAVKQKQGSDKLMVDCVPNFDELPEGSVKNLVAQMLDAAGVREWKQTLDVRKDDVPPTLKLVR